MCGSGFLVLTLTSCAVKTPPMPAAPAMPPAFRENADWKLANPVDHAVRGNWWEVFGDPQLNALESQIDVSNQTLRAQQARFLQARAAVAIAGSARYPLVTTTPSIAAGTQSGNRPNATIHQSASDFVLPVDFSYELDVWGRVRQTVAAARATAQASAADLETVRLSLHAELALDYFELRGLDAQTALLDSSVEAFQRALDLTRNRFAGGIASQADVDLAETQLETTRAQLVDVGVQRAALEHAIAELIGKAPAAFTLASLPLKDPPPDIPAGLPSDLLERRPDIAAAERRISAAASNVGVANAAFFPRLLLTAAAGFESRSLGSWLTGLSTFWSAGPAAAYTIFDANRRRATSEQAMAAFDETVADYQDTILRSLQDVEDSLSTLRILREEANVQASAVAAAERSVTQANNRYRGGVATYLEVIAAQSAALTNERTELSVLSRRLSASVLLIKALGGGWDVSTLPIIKTGTR
ncbi:MAG TPA: efflux transporter outer membrane subunit [Vicinamibacterales bacterium]|nr:efflux transporter outer membrane subunit [Vicinamibacterales bacterium]